MGAGAAVISSIAAWILYRSDWVGSVKDVMGVATVAFMSDFTLDAVLESLTKAKGA